jgi:K+-transporting ATPase KdpF subunit
MNAVLWLAALLALALAAYLAVALLIPERFQ